MKYFDTHAHYYDERFKEEMEESVDNLIGALFENSVSYIINVATSPKNAQMAIDLAVKYPHMYTALGIHPSDCQYLDGKMDNELEKIEKLILNKASKCVCLGEIGLDYHYDDTDKDLQSAYFDEQMKMAKRLKLPVCIHDRDAHGDVLDVLRRYPDVVGILHSYSGSPEMARELCDMGYFISFSGTLTFKNARKSREVAAVIPKNKILIETDCPYLAPHPLRGTLNHSGNLVYTNRVLSEILNISQEECAALTESNAKRVFNLND